MQNMPSSPTPPVKDAAPDHQPPLSALTLLAEARFMLVAAACIGVIGYLILPDPDANHAETITEPAPTTHIDIIVRR